MYGYDMYQGGYPGGYPGPAYGAPPVRVNRATPRNVEMEIAYRLGVPANQLRFVKVTELSSSKAVNHACFTRGVSRLRMTTFMWPDGTEIIFGICEAFPTCNMVYYSTAGDASPMHF